MSHTQVCPDGSILVEGRWEATAIRNIGPLLSGERMAAQLCVIFELKDGKIYRQRRYPCYERA
ncbi:hypothetical protein LJY25_04055 [Hymenobacter sp. BT175]|uniref:hypothetical protein n=1 Tax=Hymenobacter translucens TaxID=2886507 RepID=UPI001D0EA3FC|nr:hypothetical protein [Hymenobacter translucens]MCC2545606.1 hypothetical protein [Hymenobacter translucens]